MIEKRSFDNCHGVLILFLKALLIDPETGRAAPITTALFSFLMVWNISFPFVTYYVFLNNEAWHNYMIFSCIGVFSYILASRNLQQVLDAAVKIKGGIK